MCHGLVCVVAQSPPPPSSVAECMFSGVCSRTCLSCPSSALCCVAIRVRLRELGTQIFGSESSDRLVRTRLLVLARVCVCPLLPRLHSLQFSGTVLPLQFSCVNECVCLHVCGHVGVSVCLRTCVHPRDCASSIREWNQSLESGEWEKQDRLYHAVQHWRLRAIARAVNKWREYATAQAELAERQEELEAGETDLESVPPQDSFAIPDLQLKPIDLSQSSTRSKASLKFLTKADKAPTKRKRLDLRRSQLLISRGMSNLNTLQCFDSLC
jgi:hypothetical protein